MRKIDLLPRSVLCLILLCSNSSIAQDKTPRVASADSAPKYKNPALPIDDRVADLLSRMTLEEKISQIAPAGENRAHVTYPTDTLTDESAGALVNRCAYPH